MSTESAHAPMWVVDDTINPRYPIYTRGNVGEVFPDPVAPLSWSLYGRPGAEMGWRDAWVRTGAFSADEFRDGLNDIVSVIGGYCYLNVSLARIFAVRAPGFTPELMDAGLFGVMDGVPPYTPLPTDVDPDKEAKVGATLAWVFSVEDFPAVQAEREHTKSIRAARPDFSTMTDNAILDYGVAVASANFRALFDSHLYITFLATVPLGVMTAICDAIGQSGATMTLLSGFGGVDSAAPSWAMWEIGRSVASSAMLTAEFDQGIDGLFDRVREHAVAGDAEAAAFVSAIDGFLYEFGSRGPNEWEMRSPTWETDPSLALASINLMRKSPAGESPQSRWDARAAEREPLLASLTAALAADPATQGQFAAAAAACAKFMPTRERTKTNIIRMLHEARMAFREWGRRMVAAGNFEYIEDFGLLLHGEIESFLADPASFTTILADRRDKMAMFDSIEPPFILNGETIHYSLWPKKGSRAVVVAKTGDVLTGLAGAPGSYTGRACVIDSPHELDALQPGDVLVAPITDPSWTPLFVSAGAVVVNVGAPASHAVIVSREIGLPCVVSVTDATRRIPHGSMVTVDGNSGTVTIC